MLKSLRSILLISLVFNILVALLVFSVIEIPEIKSIAKDQVETELLKQASSVSDTIINLSSGKKQSKPLQSEIQNISRITGNRVTIIDPKGVVIADSSTKQQEIGRLDNHLRRPEIDLAGTKGIGTSVRYSTTLKGDLIYSAKQIKDSNGKVIGYIRFSSPIRHADRLINNVKHALGFAFGISLLVSIILAIIISYVFTQPLVKLSDTAKKIAVGQFPQRIIRKSWFEMGALETSIENMSIKLSEMFNNLSKERSSLEAVFETMSEAVFAVDTNNKIFAANLKLEQLCGVTLKDIKGKTPREVVRNNELSDLVEQVRNSGLPNESEIKFLLPFDSVFQVYARPIQRSADNIIGVVCVLHDVTKIKKLEIYRSEFVANVSHELKTPLTSIRSYTEILLDGAINDKEHNVEFLKKINKHTLNLSSLIDDIMELSKLETGKGIIVFEKVNIKSVIINVCDVLSDRANAKKIALNNLCTVDIFINGKEGYVYRAILNILNNAINYSQAGDSVTVLSEILKESINISIKDHGIGLSKEDMTRIFERFYRVDSARSRDLGGTGLGLSIVKHIMEFHKGSVSVQSELGKGSVFTLIFPK